ncbi:MAG TPA: MFS transporter [Acidimicrobiales bacterium]|nr:MFS transporter [Acidimicrobiales bacterium]
MLVVRLADEAAYFLPSAALEAFRAELGLTYAQAGTVLALIAPGALAGTVFAVAADRGNRRAIASGGTFAFAACLAAFASGASFAVLATAAFVMGAASTAMVDAAEVALVDLAGDDLRPALARANLLGTIGDVLGPALVAAVAGVGLSWRATFWVGAVGLAIYGAVLAGADLPGPSRAVADGDDRPSSLRVLVAVGRDGRVWLVGLMSLLMGPFDEALLGFTIALLQRERGASMAVATLVALIGVSGGLLTFTVLARRVQDVAEARLLVVSGLTMTLGALMIALLGAPVFVAAGAFVTDVGLNLGWLALQHRTLTLRPGEVGSTKAVVSAIEFGGAAVPIAVGAVADRTDLVTAVGLYAVLGLVFTALAVAGARERVLPASADALEAGGRRARPGMGPAGRRPDSRHGHLRGDHHQA